MGTQKMPFEKALSAFPEDNRTQILINLDEWSKYSLLGKRVKGNIVLERNLEKKAMAKILGFVLVKVRLGEGDYDHVDYDYMELCRTIDFIGVSHDFSALLKGNYPPKSHFEKALACFSQPQQKAILHALSEWKKYNKGTRIVPNIFFEQHLKHGSFIDILKVFTKPFDLHKIESSYASVCRRHRLKGNKIEGTTNFLLGRAKPKDEFIAGLIRYQNIPKEEAKKLVRNLKKNRLTTWEKMTSFSHRETWVTWNENSPQADPFFYVSPPKARKKLCANIGLKDEQHGKPHLVFRYSQQDLQLVFPTIADAELYDHFDAAPASGHGWTKPPNESTLREDGIQNDVKPRPEGLHRGISFAYINRTVEEV